MVQDGKLGNTKNLDKMRQANARGQNGALPQLGSNLGRMSRDADELITPLPYGLHANLKYASTRANAALW